MSVVARVFAGIQNTICYESTTARLAWVSEKAVLRFIAPRRRNGWVVLVATAELGVSLLATSDHWLIRFPRRQEILRFWVPHTDLDECYRQNLGFQSQLSRQDKTNQNQDQDMAIPDPCCILVRLTLESISSRVVHLLLTGTGELEYDHAYGKQRGGK